MSGVQTEVLIIGAGPAGAVAAGLLREQGRQVLVLEREQFPRFSIGESLLPQSMEYIEEAGMLRDVVEAGFQYKNGAAFARGDQRSEFDFRDKFSPGWGTVYQVERARFDHVLIKAAERMGATVRFRHEVLAVDVEGERPQVTVRSPEGETYTVEARFLLDASGFGRVLARLLKLETPSDFPVRGALFTHVEDRVAPGTFDRNKILITVHPSNAEVWFWTIPFSNGRCSLGVVARREFLERYQGTDLERLRAIVGEEPMLSGLLDRAIWDTPARSIVGYSAKVRSLWGRHHALLGNAGEFLDPVFSSGVTIAFKSASLASAALARTFAGEEVDWERDYAAPLKAGVDDLPHLRRVVVPGRLPGRHLRARSVTGDPADDQRHPGRLRLGSEEPLRRRQPPPPGRARAAVRPLSLPTLALALVSTLGACATPGSRSETAGAEPSIGTATPLESGLPLLRLSPASLGASLSLAQRLSFAHQDDPGAPRTLEALLEIDSDAVRLAGLALGQRVFTLQWDGEVLEEQRAPQVPAQLQASQVLRDLQLVYWPAEAVRAALPPDWTLEEGARTRALLSGGRVRVQVRYDSEPRWSGRVELDNHSERYRLAIESVPTSG